MKINVHGGHNKLTPGAHSLLDELTEDRKVKAKVINLLRAAGHTVYDCTDDKGKTEDDNLVNIVKSATHTRLISMYLFILIAGATTRKVTAILVVLK